jgi:hypothetical protein
MGPRVRGDDLLKLTWPGRRKVWHHLTSPLGLNTSLLISMSPEKGLER